MLIDNDGVLDLDILRVKLWQVSAIIKSACETADEQGCGQLGDILGAAGDIADSLSSQIGKTAIVDFV